MNKFSLTTEKIPEWSMDLLDRGDDPARAWDNGWEATVVAQRTFSDSIVVSLVNLMLEHNGQKRRGPYGFLFGADGRVEAMTGGKWLHVSAQAFRSDPAKIANSFVDRITRVCQQLDALVRTAEQLAPIVSGALERSKAA